MPLDILTPPKTEGVFALPVTQLRACNEATVRRMIAAGERDAERLLAALGTWPREWPEGLPVRLSFLGVCLTFACDMQPRCIYCNQRPVCETMGIEDWKALVRGLAPVEGDGPYLYITGGEPLLLGEDLWGHEGLIHTATESRAACNINTNALLLTPEASEGLVRAGLGRVHISLDTHRPEVQDAIYQQTGRWEQVVQGIRNLQAAKSALGVSHPLVHINCVLTRLNAFDLPEFLAFLLDMKPLVDEGLSPDFDFHLIPVGGEANRDLRLSAAEYERFFTETWEAADVVWQRYQADRGVPEDKRGKLHEKLPFCSPYHRVQHRGSLAEWAACAGEGRPASLSLTPRCYVAPTQSFVLPDGSQFWCGGHSVSRPEPVGNVLEHSVQDNIRAAMPQLAALPAPHCRNCPGATQAINQIVENSLRDLIAEWVAEADAPGSAPRGNVPPASASDLNEEYA
jgi:MoaA/NifB/PqqE/SkfB family radical SAM enzyme